MNRSAEAHSPAAGLPVVLFTDDIGRVLKTTPGAVRKALNRGELGPYGRRGRRLFVFAESFFATLKASLVRELQAVMKECR